MTSALPSVFLVEASDGTRHLVVDFLERSGQVRVVGSAADRGDAADKITRTRPDVVIVDRLPAPPIGSADDPVDNGVGAKLILHTTTVPDRTPAELRQAGVHEVVFKEVGMLDDLIAAVQRVANSSRSSGNHDG